MNLLLHLREALANLKSAKLRSFLAILGILVGTGSVVAMVSGGQLATQHALDQFSSLGTDLLSVSLYSQKKNTSSSAQEGTIEAEQLQELKQQIPAIKSIAPYMNLYASISFEGHDLNAPLIAVTENLQSIIKIQMHSGRFISDLDRYSNFVIVGRKLTTTLQKQGHFDLLSKQITLNNQVFTIIGTIGDWPENNFFNQDINNSLIIPLPMANRLSPQAEINSLIMQLSPDVDIEQVQTQIEQWLKEKNPDLRIFIRSAKQIIASMTNQQKTLTLLLALIGSISLLVGGIGIMNIMLVSVVERGREIGIRMAVGAKRRDIQLMFLIEAITLTFFGGLLGVTLGIAASYFISVFANWQFKLFLLPPSIGFAVSVIIGIFFGFYPAYKASRLDPIQTLRSE